LAGLAATYSPKP